MSKKFNCEIVSLESVYELSKSLSKQLIDYGYKADIVIGIARGGFVPARLVCDFLGQHNLTCVKVEHYSEGAEKSEEARVKYPVNADVEGKKILLVDDINDTGESLDAAFEHLMDKGAAEIKTAVIHQKQETIREADFVAEYIKEWRWVIYQWAVVEDIGAFVKKLDANNFSDAQKGLAENYGIRMGTEELTEILKFSGYPWVD